MRTEVSKFFRKLIYVLPLLGLVLGINALFGATGFSDALERVNAARQAQGETLIADLDEDDRLELRARIALTPAPYDVFVLGTSRSYPLSSRMFPGKSFLNGSVLGGELRDQIGIYEVLREYRRLPKFLILTVEPQLVQSQSSEGFRGRSLSLSEEYFRAATRMGLNKPLFKTWDVWANQLCAQFQLLSPMLLQESLAHASKLMNELPTENSWNVEHPHPELAVQMPDRALVYSQRQSAPTQTQIQASLAPFLKAPAWGKDQKLDPDVQHEFETFVRSVQSDGVQLIFFLAPFHSLYFESLNGTRGSKFMDEAEEYFNHLARELKIPKVGSYHPERAGCTENDFMDAAHPLEKCESRVWQDARARGLLP